MKQIRKSVFETNSSSTHTLTMCTKEEYDDWKNGKLLFDIYHKKFVPLLEEQETYIPGYIKKNGLMNNVVTYQEWLDSYDYYLNIFYREYTTKNNEKIVAFGAYGYDG